MLSNVDRAKQFKPFSALSGYEETLKLVEQQVEEKFFINLSKKIQRIKVNDVINIKHYSGIEYLETNGRVKKIDKINRKIELLDCIIAFDDIIDIVL